MIENILVYRWDYDCEPAIVSNLTALGYHCLEFREQFTEPHLDTTFMMHVMDCIRKESIQMVFSWNYVPLLANACEMQKIPYLSWICNLSDHKLLSKTILHPHNYLFCFDRVYSERLAVLGCAHVYHYPLAVDIFDHDLGEIQTQGRYIADIAVIGGPVADQKDLTVIEGLSEYTAGYIAGIEEAQIRVYGYNFVEKMLDETVARDIQQRAGIERDNMFFDDPQGIAAQMVNREITKKEYQRVIARLAEHYRLDLYTDSQYRDRVGEMPLIISQSRINVTIAPKAVQSGIPQRVLDILSCGGFCLTNYQPEVAEIFEDGTELVMYTDIEDMAQKVDWYLSNENERAAIARAGYIKVREQFSMRERLAGIIRIVEDAMS